MIAADNFVAAFGSVPPGDDEATLKVIIHAVRLGFAIVLCKPDDKVPLCTLNTRDKARANREAQEAAAAAGDPQAGRRRHACGLSHALTKDMVDDPTKLAPKIGTIYRRLVKERGRVNVGVELGRSRMLVVDVDTAAEAAGFRRDWQQAIDYQLGPEDDITVQSPGRQDPDGNWVHRDGGHFWFTLPEDVELPRGMGSWRAPSGWVAMWADHQVLVPPSFRPEGAYVLVGQPQEAPGWLLDRLLAEGAERASRQRERASRAADGTSDIDQWAATVPWAELLEPDGWVDTGLPDTCGCPIWTAPGPHASRKSATAHDLGCDTYDTAPGHAPLHIWTDNPPEWLLGSGRTLTKLQYEAARHGGDLKAALRGLGLNNPEAPRNDPSLFAIPEAADDDESIVPDLGHDRPQEDETAADQQEQASDEIPDSWARIPLHGLGEVEETPASLMPRTDGVCLLYRGLVHSVHGESESGKSWIVQAEVIRVAREGGTVLFLDFENDFRQVLARFRALGASESELERIDYRNPENKPDGSPAWVAMFTGSYELAVLDGMTDALGVFGLASKDNDDVSVFLRKFPRTLARRTGAAVVVIDHVTKDKDTRGRFAIGGQAKMAGLDGAAYYVDVVNPLGRGLKGELRIQVAKDKPGWIRGKALGFDKNRLATVAIFTLDSTTPGSVVPILTEPDPSSLGFADPFGDQPPSRQDRMAQDVLRLLRTAGAAGLKSGEIKKGVQGEDSLIIGVCEELRDAGALTLQEVGTSKTWRITDIGIRMIKDSDPA